MIRDFCGVRLDGKWAARTGLLVCPRQNGKGGALEALELMWMFLRPEDRLIVHTAHRFDTSQEHFIRLRSLIEDCPHLSKRLAKNGIRTANGSEGFKLADGTRLLFKARSKGAIRGPSPDKIVIDEAYYLWDEALSAVLPSQGARPNPQTIYASSSPIPGPESDVLRRMCKQGRKGKGMAYTEFSCEVGADLDDEDNWYAANPSLGILLDIESLRSDRATMSDEGFAQEHLGIWSEDDVSDPGALDAAGLERNTLAAVPSEWISDDLVFGVEGNATGDWVSVAAAGKVGDRVAAELVRHELGTDWLLPWAKEAQVAHKPKAWAFDPRSATADLFLAAFRDAGLPVVECGMKDRALPRAHVGFADDIANDRLWLLTHPMLDAAAQGAIWRFVGESRLFDFRPGVVRSPLLAASLARFAATEEPAAEPVPFLIRR